MPLLSVQNLIDTLSDLGTGQRVRLTFEDSNRVELRVNQKEEVVDERLRLELTGGRSGDSGRYRLETHVEAGEWTSPLVQRYDRDAEAWTTFDGVTDVTPLGMFRTMPSDDMKAQEGTGTGRNPTDGGSR